MRLRRRHLAAALTAATAAAAGWVGAVHALPGPSTTELVDISAGGATTSNNFSYRHSLSADGTIVAFTSQANDLGPSDTNGTSDVYVRNMSTGVTTLVNVDASGVQGTGAADNPALSADGRWLAFGANSALLPADVNATGDVYLRDLAAGPAALQTISVATASTVPRGGMMPSVSADGTKVAFWSYSNQLVAGDTNNRPDLFVRDLTAGTTTRINVSTAGVQSNGNDAAQMSAKISADGRFVVFSQSGGNLVAGTPTAAHVYLRDLVNNTTTLVDSVGGTYANGDSRWPSISDDGRYVTYHSLASDLVAGDTNGVLDVFRFDTVAGVTVRVSTSDAGAEADGASGWESSENTASTVSSDGRYVVFTSAATNLIGCETSTTPGVYVKDLATGAVLRATYATGDAPLEGTSAGAQFLGISGNGRYVTFTSTVAATAEQIATGSTYHLYEREMTPVACPTPPPESTTTTTLAPTTTVADTVAEVTTTAATTTAATTTTVPLTVPPATGRLPETGSGSTGGQALVALAALAGGALLLVVARRRRPSDLV